MFRIFYHHNRRIWNIHPDFYNRSRYKHLYLICCKPFHNVIFLRRFHLSMQKSDFNRIRQFLFQTLRIVCDILCLHILALFHQRTDHIRLMTGSQYVQLLDTPANRKKMTAEDSALVNEVKDKTAKFGSDPAVSQERADIAAYEAAIRAAKGQK